MLPAKLGQIGAISIFSWIVTATGAMCLALAFGKCGMYSKKPGGMGGYAEYAFGRSGNFLVNYTYGISIVIADTAMALSATGYGAALLGINLTPFMTAVGTVGILWVTTVLNFWGPHYTGRISSITVWGVITPCLLLSTICWFWFSPDLYVTNWNVIHLPFGEAVTQAITMTLWAFLGLETACANSDSVDDPQKNVPRAILGGITLAALCYILTTNIMFGIVPAGNLADSSAPFGYVFATMFNDGIGKLVVGTVLINDFGSLLGWQFTIGNVFKSSANVGYFPKIFGKVNRYSAPVAGMLIIVCIQTCIAFMTVSPSLIKQYEVLVDLAVVMNVVPYLLAMTAVTVLMMKAGCDAMDIKKTSALAFIGSVYSLYACYASGLQALAYGGLVTFMGWTLYGLVAKRFEL